MRPWLLLVFALAFSEAASADCGKVEVLEAHASAGKLSEAERGCIEQELTTAEPGARIELSFVLVLQALMAGDNAAYAAQMDRHLSTVHTTDPEVAYLYSTWLQKHAPHRTAEILHWADVAFAGRGAWVSDLRNYTAIVRSIWDLRVEASLQAAIVSERAWVAAPTPETEAALDRARRLARYYLVAATPCLHYGDCGPQYDVEIEGATSCEDLDAVERELRASGLHSDTVSCLKSRWYRNPRPKILELLVGSANRRADTAEWESLLAWHWNATGTEDPSLALAYARFLSSRSNPAEVWRWAGLALADRTALTASAGGSSVAEALRLRLDAAEALVAAAQAAGGTSEALAEARANAAASRADHEAWCAASPKDCR